MAKIILSDTMDRSKLDISEKLWVYNSLDCTITREIGDVLRSELDSEQQMVYNFTLAMQAPALEMMLRGVLVDENERVDMIWKLQEKVNRLECILSRFAHAVWDRDLNTNSPHQLKAFFYDVMKLPEVRLPSQGQMKVSTSREALEKLSVYLYAKPIINVILLLKDYKKKISVLKSGVDADGRMRGSFNIVGTDTGRWSSSQNAFGTGMNMQNPTDFVRRIFWADPGKKLAYIDLEQAESRDVAYISGDEAYIEACESGDLHTTVCRMVWPELPWSGELSHDKNKVAGMIFYRDFTYRDMSKRGGHGTNYYGKPWTMARHLKVESKVMEDFQENYFSAFPGIPEWHKAVARQLQTTGMLTTFLGRKRYFFGRRYDDATLRKAIAYEPQSTVGDILNFALWKIWKHSPELNIEILSQLHDAVLIQYPEELEDEILPKVLELMTISVPVKGRTMTIPCDAQSGWNWGKYNDNQAKGELNPGGLKTWTGHDERTRPTTKKTSMLDRVIL